jgi:hypothetical protein
MSRDKMMSLFQSVLSNNEWKILEEKGTVPSRMFLIQMVGVAKMAPNWPPKRSFMSQYSQRPIRFSL